MRNALLGLIAVTTITAGTSATSPMNLATIDEAVAEFTGADVGEPGGAKLPVDRRLRLVACQSELDLQWFGRDRRSVQVSCPAPMWRIFVGIDGVSGAATGGADVAQGEKMIRRGETVSILARGKGFTLTRHGSAVEDGAQGQWIKVRASGERVETLRAVVLGPGKVGIDLP